MASDRPTARKMLAQLLPDEIHDGAFVLTMEYDMTQWASQAELLDTVVRELHRLGYMPVQARFLVQRNQKTSIVIKTAASHGT